MGIPIDFSEKESSMYNQLDNVLERLERLEKGYERLEREVFPTHLCCCPHYTTDAEWNVHDGESWDCPIHGRGQIG